MNERQINCTTITIALKPVVSNIGRLHRHNNPTNYLIEKHNNNKKNVIQAKRSF